MSDEAFSAWFDALYTRYASDIIRVSYFYLGDRGKAEDVCHVCQPVCQSPGAGAWA